VRLPHYLEGGDGLLLRRWRPQDAEILATAVAESADHLRPWMDWMKHEPMTVERRRSWIVQRDQEWARGGDAPLGVFVDERVAGGCGLHRRVGDDGLEIGYWIHPAFTRRGIGTEAARLLTGAALALPGITQVEIHHDKANVASQGIPHKLGYRLVAEAPDEIRAPAEVGIDCAWHMDAERWQALSEPV
jgi:RimJ/RimL family protein N-acetyltransferase